MPSIIRPAAPTGSTAGCLQEPETGMPAPGLPPGTLEQVTSRRPAPFSDRTVIRFPGKSGNSVICPIGCQDGIAFGSGGDRLLEIGVIILHVGHRCIPRTRKKRSGMD